MKDRHIPDSAVLKPGRVAVREVTARSLLCRSGIEGVDYAVNPYTGCAHGCLYCYASFMKRFTGHQAPWGQFVDVKVNAPAVLARELRRPRSGEVLLSSVTDPYQPLEREYQLTRSIMQLLRQQESLTVSILTKSDLVLRDLDILRSFPGLEVGFTVTTADDRIGRLVEPGAPVPSRRLNALARLGCNGIRTWAFLGPVLPVLGDNERQLSTVLEKLSSAGAGEIAVDCFNPYPSAVSRLESLFRQEFPHLVPRWQQVLGNYREYQDGLRQGITGLSRQKGIPLQILF